MAIDMLKRSLEILKNASVETGKNYFSNVSALKEDASIIKDNITKGVNTVADVYRKMKTGPGPLKSLSNWFYERGEQYGDFDDGDDEFDAGFDTDTGESQASAVLDTNSMRDIARGQVGAMYQIGGKQVEAAAANTAEIITTLNSRTSEITVSINNMNKTLLDISKRLEGISSVIVAKTEREQQQMPDSLVDYNGRLKLDQIAGRMWSKGIKESTPVQLGGMILPMLFQSGPTEAASLLMSMLLTGKEWNTKTDLGKRLFGDKASIDKIGERANKFIGDLTDTIVNGLLSSKPFQKMFPDIFTNRAMGGDYSSYRKNTYTAERAVFDGYTRTTIVDIIPAYLKEITKAVTGKSLGIDKTGRLTEKADNEFVNAAVRGTFSATGMSYERSGQMYAQYKSTHGDSGFSASQYRAISKALVTAYTWQFFTGYEKSEHVTPVLLERYRKAATRQAIQIIRGSQGGNNVSEAQILEVIDLILAPVLVDRSWNPEAREFERDIQANLQRLHSQAVKAAQDYHTGKNAGRLKEREINSAAIRSLDEYGIFGGSDELSSEGATARQLDEKYIAQWQGKEQLTPEIKRKLEEAKRRIEDNAYQRKSGDKSSVSSSGRSLIEFNQHFEDLGVNILRKLHDVIQVKIVTKKPKEFYPDWMKGKAPAPASGSETEKFGGGGEPTKPGSGTSTAGGTEDTRTTEQKLSDGVDAVIDGAKGAIARVQESVAGYIDSSDPNSLTNKVARLLFNDGKTTDGISSKIGAAGSKIGGAISKVGTAVRTRGGSILQWARDEASNMWDDASNAAHSFLDRRLEERENRKRSAEQAGGLRGVLAHDDTISDSDKTLADTVLGMVQAATSTGDGKADSAAINDKIRQIKDQKLRQNLSSAVKTMLDTSSKQEDQPAKSKLGKILKWALAGIGVVFKPIISAVKSVGKLLLRGLKFVGRFFKGAAKQAGSALKEIGKDLGTKIKNLGNTISRQLKPIKDSFGKFISNIGKGLRNMTDTIGQKLTGWGNKWANSIEGDANALNKLAKNGRGSRFWQGFKSTAFTMGDEEEEAKRQQEIAEAQKTTADILAGKGDTNNVITAGCKSIVDALEKILHKDDPNKNNTPGQIMTVTKDKSPYDNATAGGGRPNKLNTSNTGTGASSDNGGNTDDTGTGASSDNGGNTDAERSANQNKNSGVVSGILQQAGPLGSMISGVTDVIQGDGSPIGKLIGVVAKILFSVGAFRELFSELMGGLREALQPIIDVVSGVKDLVKPLFKILTSLFTSIAKPLKEVLKLVVDVIGPIMELVGGAISKIVEQVMNVLTPMIETISNAVKTVTGMLEVVLGMVIKGLGDIGFVVAKILYKLTFNRLDLSEPMMNLQDFGKSLYEMGKQNWREGIAGIIRGMQNLVDGVAANYGSGSREDYRERIYGDYRETAPTGSAMEGYTGSGDTYNIVYRNMYGSGNTSQYSYGTYMNMRERGCGPVALADAYSRRTGGNVNAATLASTMAGSGAYSANRGTSVAGYISTANALGMGVTPGGVTARSLRTASPTNPITVVGSGTGYATRSGNTHYMNVVGSDGRGTSYVANPITGRVGRVATADIVNNALLGLYGSGDILASMKMPDSVTTAYNDLLNLASSWVASTFLGGTSSQKAEKAANLNAQEQKLRAQYGSAKYDAVEKEARKRFEEQYPRDPNESTNNYEKRWQNHKQEMMVQVAAEKLEEENTANPYLNTDFFDSIESKLREKYGYDMWDASSSVYSNSEAAFEELIAKDQAIYNSNYNAAMGLGGDSEYYDSGAYSGSGYDVEDLIKSVASIYKAYIIKNPKGTYNNGLSATINVNGRSRRLRPDCSGIVSAGIQELGYVLKPNGVDTGESGARSWEFAKPNSNTLIYDANGQISNDWIVLPYSQSALQRGDITAGYWNGHGHVSLPVTNLTSTYPKGLDGGGTSNIKESAAAAQAYLNGSSNIPWRSAMGSRWSGNNGAQRIWRFIGRPKQAYGSAPSSYLGTDATAQQIFSYLVTKNGMSQIGAAGMMGCFKYEAGLRSNNLEDKFQSQWGYQSGDAGDIAYTNAVNSGLETEDMFVRSHGTGKAGYGIAQFTAQNVKQDLYNHTVRNNYSIDNLSAQLDIITKQLKSRKYGNQSLFDAIRLAKDPREANKLFLWRYEAGTGYNSDAAVAKAYPWMGMKGIEDRHTAAENFYSLYGGKSFVPFTGDSAAGLDAYNAGIEDRIAKADGVVASYIAGTNAGDAYTAMNANGEFLFNSYNKTSFNSHAWDAMSKQSGYYTYDNGKRIAFGFKEDEPASLAALRLIRGSGDVEYVPPVSTNLADYFLPEEMQTGNTTNNITVVRQDNTSREDQITALMNHTFEVKSATIESLLKQILTEVQSRKNTQQTSTGRKSPADLFDNAHIPYQIERLTTG